MLLQGFAFLLFMYQVKAGLCFIVRGTDQNPMGRFLRHNPAYHLRTTAQGHDMTAGCAGGWSRVLATLEELINGSFLIQFTTLVKRLRTILSDVNNNCHDELCSRAVLSFVPVCDAIFEEFPELDETTTLRAILDAAVAHCDSNDDHFHFDPSSFYLASQLHSTMLGSGLCEVVRPVDSHWARILIRRFHDAGHNIHPNPTGIAPIVYYFGMLRGHLAADQMTQNEFKRATELRDAQQPLSLQTLFPQLPFDVLVVYHGTHAGSCERILRGGFDTFFCKRGKFGEGLYFASNPAMAQRYAKQSEIAVHGAAVRGDALHLALTNILVCFIRRDCICNEVVHGLEHGVM